MANKKVVDYEKSMSESEFDSNNLKRIESSSFLLDDIIKRFKGEEGQLDVDTVDVICKQINTDTKSIKGQIMCVRVSKSLKDGTL